MTVAEPENGREAPLTDQRVSDPMDFCDFRAALSGSVSRGEMPAGSQDPTDPEPDEPPPQEGVRALLGHSEEHEAARPRIGRPSKVLEGYGPYDLGTNSPWTPESYAGKVLLAIRGGARREAAARWAGIHRDTLNDWLARGRKHDNDDSVSETETPFRDFRDAFERAEAALEIDVTRQWKAFTATSGRECERFLAKRFPEHWGDRIEQRIETTTEIRTHQVDLELTEEIRSNPAALQAAYELEEALLAAKHDRDDYPDEGSGD